MKRLFSNLWLPAVAALLLLAPVAAVPAQELKPLAVVSIAPVDKLLADVDYLTKAAGAADAGALVPILAGAYIDALDSTKPAGAYVTLDGETPVSVGFLPTKDLAKLQTVLEDQLGKATDVGNGVQQMGPVFMKLQGSYTFVAQDAAHLASLPKDPVALLGGLDKTYSFAAKLTVKNVPQMFKDQLIAQMKEGFENAPIPMDDDADPAQKELQDKLSRNALDQMVRLVDESNEITLGWAVDPASKSTYIDVLYTALDGTKLAKQMAALKDAKTNFAGFLLPEAAFSGLSSSTTTDKEEIGQTLALIDGFHAQAIKELEKEELDEDEQEALEELIDSAVEVLSATVEQGKFDGGAVALADDKALTFVAGGHVVDAPKLEAAVKKAITFAQKKKPEEFEGKEILFDSGKHGGVRFHTLKLPVDDEKAQKAFGEKLDVIIGFGDNVAYVAFGSKAEAILKQVIDQSATEAGKAVLPAQATIAVAPILKFVDSIEANPATAALLAAAGKVKGNDRLLMTVSSIPNGEKIRIQLEEGVLQIIGAGAKAAQGAGGGAGGF